MKLVVFHGPEVSLPYSKDRNTWSYSKPDGTTPSPHTVFPTAFSCENNLHNPSHTVEMGNV